MHALSVARLMLNVMARPKVEKSPRTSSAGRHDLCWLFVSEEWSNRLPTLYYRPEHKLQALAYQFKESGCTVGLSRHHRAIASSRVPGSHGAHCGPGTRLLATAL